MAPAVNSPREYSLEVKELGLFGGVSFIDLPALPLIALMLEYNPDQYDGEFSRMVS